MHVSAEGAGQHHHEAAFVFERSGRTGEVPEDQEKENVPPVFQKSKKSEPGNCRLISLSSTTGKVMDQLILKQFLNI